MSHDDPRRPSLTTPALHAAAGLSDDNIYGGIMSGQSNSLPWGLPSEAFDTNFALELQPLPTGLDIEVMVPANTGQRAIGAIEQLASADVLDNTWNTSTQIRFGTNKAPLRGYADVLLSSPGLLRVKWIETPVVSVIAAGSFVVGSWYQIVTLGSTDFTLIGAASNTVGLEFQATGVGTGTGTARESRLPAYLVRENGLFASYPNAKVLTPFMPWRDWVAPVPGASGTGVYLYTPPTHAPYPATTGVLGKSLTLPAPYNNPTQVADFEDMGLMLPMTRREGADGYGVSELADSTYDGEEIDAPDLINVLYYRISAVGTTDFTLIGAASNTVGLEFQKTGPAGTGTGKAVLSPIGHPIHNRNVVTGGHSFEVKNGLPDLVFSNAYVIVEWLTGTTPQRSWNRVRTNSTTAFTVDTPWLGDGTPPDPTEVAGVTWNSLLNAVEWPSSTPADGQKVFFEGPDIPAEVVPNRVYYVINQVGSIHQIAEFPDGPPVAFDTISQRIAAGSFVVGRQYRITFVGTTDFTAIGAASNTVGVEFVATGVGAGTGLAARTALTGVVAGSFVIGQWYRIVSIGSTDFTLIGAASNTVGLEFQATGVGSGTGTADEVAAGPGWHAITYTVWIPHWRDNPHTYLPGPEFAYPNEDSQPRNTFVHFRARGQYGWAYNNQVEPGSGLAFTEPFEDPDSRFGPLLPYAWRMGSALGKVLHMVHLGVGSTPLAPAMAVNTARGIFTGTLGWWDYSKFGYAIALEDPNGFLAARLKRLVDFVAPQALVAEGITKPLRYLTHCHIQGEADGFTVGGRETYRSLISGFREWMRNVITDAGLSPFANGAKMPFAQPLITHIPYEVSSSLPYSDVDGEINDAIREVHTDEEFSAYTLSDDLPKINDGHYSGGGMVVLGARLAVAALDALEYALTHGSPALRTATHAKVLEIVNNALSLVGQGAKEVADLSANTTEARNARRFWPKALEQLMGQRSWSWATRHEPAALYKHHNHPRYKFAYVVPGRAASVTAIQPFQEAATEGVYVSVIAPVVQDEILDRGPYRYEIEKSPAGSRILYTDVPQVDGAIETQIPIPSNVLFPERLPKRPLLRYVDKNVDPSRYSPSFVNALSYLLAGFMAPALIRGKAGMDAQKEFNAAAAAYISAESQYEAINQTQPLVHQPDWIRSRWE